MTVEHGANSSVLTPQSRQTLIDYMRGPLVLISAVMLLLIIGAYGALGEWGNEQILALSIGMTCGMLISSGFAQAIVRRGSIYLSLDDSGAASRFLRLSAAVAGTCIAVVAIMVVLITNYLGVLDASSRLTFSLAFVGLAAIWLIAAELSLVQATGWLGIGLAAGLAAGVITDRAAALWSEAHLALGTIVGFTLALGLMLKALNDRLNAKSSGRSSPVVLPSVAYLVHEAAPYFTYGLLYMIFILTPHILGWFGIIHAQQERSWAVASVEVGLTLSLIPVILVGGVGEHALRLFWLRARELQATLPGTDPDRFGAILVKSYWQQLRRYLAILTGISLVAYILFRASISSGLLSSRVQLPSLEAAEYIFNASLIAYWLIGWGLFNCMFCVTMARPGLAWRAVVIGLVTMLIVGVVLSLSINFVYAALAFIAGGAAFVAVSSLAIRHLFESASYYYFSSF